MIFKMMKWYFSRLFRMNACGGMVALLAVLFWVGNASALEYLGGDLSIHGKVIAQYGVHLQDAETGGPDFESGDPSMAQTWADLEVSYSPIDFLRFSAIVRGYKEWAYQVSGAYNSRFQVADQGRQDPQGRFTKGYNRQHRDWGEDVDLRECFVDIALAEYGGLRVGRQQITWGEADGIRLADIINPLNIARHFNLEEWEDLRIPIWAAYANLTHPAINDFTFDLVFTGDYERAIRGEPGSNTPWAFPLPNRSRLFNPFGADLDPYFFYDEPKDWCYNYEYGIRIRYKSPLAGAEFSAFYFHTTNDTPVLEQTGFFAPAPFPAPPVVMLPIINLRYKPYDNFGFTFNTYSNALKTVFRGEFVYVKDQEFNHALPGFIGVNAGPPGLMFDVTEADQYRGMLGFDRQVFIPFLNSHKSFFVSGQYFYLYQDDHDNLLDPTYVDQYLEEVTQVCTLKINTAYMMESLAPDVLFIVSPDDGFWQVQSKLTYTTSSFHWSYTLGANLMGGKSNFQEFGLFERNNEVYFKMKYSF